jgi:hypothetical protein
VWGGQVSPPGESRYCEAVVRAAEALRRLGRGFDAETIVDQAMPVRRARIPMPIGTIHRFSWVVDKGDGDGYRGGAQGVWRVQETCVWGLKSCPCPLPVVQAMERAGEATIVQRMRLMRIKSELFRQRGQLTEALTVIEAAGRLPLADTDDWVKILVASEVRTDLNKQHLTLSQKTGERVDGGP